jgi:hypothetical protein
VYTSTVFAEEFGPPAWNYQPPSGTAPTGAGRAIVGLQSCIWNAFNPSFFSSLRSFFASQDVTDVSIYDVEVLAACAPAYPDNGESAAQYPTSLADSRRHGGDPLDLEQDQPAGLLPLLRGIFDPMNGSLKHET